jgi:putative transposase
VSRYRLEPTAAQEAVLLRHCGDAGYVWNLCCEQQSWWRPGRSAMPGFAERCRQLTAARADNPWLADGSVTVQQQAIRDFDQAMRNFFGGTHRKPSWRKAGRHEGFRIIAVKPEHVRRLNRRHGTVLVPKAGWVRFRWSRQVPDARSYRVTRDPAGRWHVAFAVVPEPVEGPGTGEVVGIDRGVAVTLALSDGTILLAPAPKDTRQLARRLSRAKRGSNRRRRAKLALARLKAANANRLNDWAHKTSTTVAASYDVIRIEDLQIPNMVRSARGTVEKPGRNVRQKAGLNRSVLEQGWGAFARHLEYKAPGRVEKVNPAYTSQRCSECGNTDRDSRKSQALYLCVSCGYSANADVNAARNIAAGQAARGDQALARSVNREPQLALLAS